MAEYIERDKAIDELRQYIVDPKKAISDHSDDIEKFNDGIDTAISVLSTLPTADVQPVKHGKWDDDSVAFYRRCSVCGCCLVWAKFCFLDEQGEYNFCPNCGADMRGET